MAAVLVSLLARFALASICTYLLWLFLVYLFFLKGYSADFLAVKALTLLGGGPIWFFAFAKPIYRALDRGHSAARFAMFRDVHGSYFAFKGHKLTVQNDEAGHPWICASGLREVLNHLPVDRVLLNQFKEGAELRGRDKVLWLKADALRSYLETGMNKHSIDFKNWLQKTVLRPASRRRGEPWA